MQKPSQEEIEKASDERLNEWAAVWVMNCKKKRITRGPLGSPFGGWFKEDGTLLEYCRFWNPAQNIGQAMELVEKFRWISLIKTPHRSLWQCEIRTWKGMEPVWFFCMLDETKERAITKAAIMAAMER